MGNFLNCNSEHEQHKPKKPVKQDSTFSESDFPNKTRNFGIAAAVSALAMIVYAASTGIIQVIQINRNVKSAIRFYM